MPGKALAMRTISETCRSLMAKAILVAMGIVVVMTLQVLAVEKENAKSGRFTDDRDGTEYGWVRIGSQVWIAENLRFRPEAGWKCWNDDEVECAEKGVFYNWETARVAVPEGWHLPSDEEWKVLERELGIPEDKLDLVGLDRVNNAGSTIKKAGFWVTEYNGKPIVFSNETGFSAIPTGFFALGDFTHSGYAGWWTSTPEGEKAWVRALSFNDNMLTRAANDKKFFFPVRCIRDE
ncbi:MAG TPA: FISUMP domain-containing protein [Candidatus Krumholzibacterium sp.]|nr:FISUMP domain-containing protein [Candidatus Krumholzibacterium sp.]